MKLFLPLLLLVSASVAAQKDTVIVKVTLPTTAIKATVTATALATVKSDLVKTIQAAAAKVFRDSASRLPYRKDTVLLNRRDTVIVARKDTVVVQSGNTYNPRPLQDSLASLKAQVEALSGSTIELITGEEPAGAVNSVNKVYTLSAAPLAGSEEVYADGLRLRRNVYSFTDNKLYLGVAPKTSIIVNYRKK